jgi:hypothetical protein
VTRLRHLAALAASALVLSSCTLVSTSSSPSLISSAAVPLGLLEPTIPFTDYAQVRWVTRDIYLLNRSRHLEAVARLMTAPPSLLAALYYVTQGPTTVEMAAGVTTLVPPLLVINQATVHDGVALIDVSKDLSQIPLADQRVAVAQLVFTAAAMGATRGVRLSINQTPYSLKLATGVSVSLITPAQLRYLTTP